MTDNIVFSAVDDYIEVTAVDGHMVLLLYYN